MFFLVTSGDSVVTKCNSFSKTVVVSTARTTLNLLPQAGHLISRGIGFLYPLHSVDFTLPDAFMWRILRERIFCDTILRNLQVLSESITCALHSICLKTLTTALKVMPLSLNMSCRCHFTVKKCLLQ